MTSVEFTKALIWVGVPILIITMVAVLPKKKWKGANKLVKIVFSCYVAPSLVSAYNLLIIGLNLTRNKDELSKIQLPKEAIVFTQILNDSVSIIVSAIIAALFVAYSYYNLITRE